MDMTKEDLQEFNALIPAITLMIELMQQQKKEREQLLSNDAEQMKNDQFSLLDTSS